MKIIICILSIIMLFNQCSLKPKVKEESKVKIQVEIIGKTDINKFKDIGGIFYSAKIGLLNNTDTVFEFWTMACSWQDNWIFETDSLRLFNEGCTGNYPIVKQIKSRDKLVYKKAIIFVKSSLNYIKGKNIKLGFVLIKRNEISKDIEFREVLNRKIKERKDIIWSEPFKIDK